MLRSPMIARAMLFHACKGFELGGNSTKERRYDFVFRHRGGLLVVVGGLEDSELGGGASEAGAISFNMTDSPYVAAMRARDADG